MQAALGGIDSVPCFFFWCRIGESAHLRPLANRRSGERAPANAPGVHQFEICRHGCDAKAGAVTQLGSGMGCVVHVRFDIQLSSLVFEELA